MPDSMILPLLSDEASLDRVGGKGTNLAMLTRRGYPVPASFLVTTDAYRGYVSANSLGALILDTCTTIQPDDPADLDQGSRQIRNAFSAGTIPPEIVSELREAYASLGRPPVAVRSSATAEDLPEMSFAGQQDTFLHVIGDDALLEAVVNCWSSLWTARAIGYRHRNRIPHDEVALAIVVQEMVPAETSGVLFTANPLTGVRTQTVIDATLGLGEALVSGQVDPDHYVVDTTTGRILTKELGAKSVAIHGASGGGVVSIQEDAEHRQALPDDQILQLAQIGRQVAAEYGFPQDIEWAWAAGQLQLLQSRPITALYPVPEGMSTDPLQVLLSFAAIQGIMGPLTPLGQDAIRVIFAGGGRLFGFQETHESQGAIHSAAQRLWVDITPLVRNSVGRKLARRSMVLAEPSIGQVLDTLADDPRLVPERRGMRLVTLCRIGRFMLPFWGNVFRSWQNPEGRRGHLQRQMDTRIATIQAQSDALSALPDPLPGRVALIHELSESFPFVVPGVFSPVIGGMLPWFLLKRLAGHLPEGEQASILELARGLPHNVTTEMDLSLWETAQTIRADAASAECFQAANTGELAADYVKARLPAVAQSAISGFMEDYGVRGLGEIDFGRPRWREDPAQIIQTLKSYLLIENEAPDALFRRGAEEALATSKRIEAAVRRTRGGWLKARFVRWATRRFRALAGLRESPKFYIMRSMGIIRKGLLKSGRDMVAARTLRQPDDLFFLTISELEALAEGKEHDWSRLIAARRQAHAREEKRNRIPRVLLSDGQVFHEGIAAPIGAEPDLLVGSPVSPGLVEGQVRVVLDPIGTQLAPGEILVCPGTDPAWTPLFLAAGGLVMEVGGMMTHGSVVAREYGIPAVVGVDQATQRLKTGQRVQVDGSAGRIRILEP